ncbi:cellulase family glycosylhydrolase [Chitinophaga silvisoli]|uniref:T9SS C-terminal target domain-containing protein n=1 Tax=Chitinophaga silvisoli TaxID=2291814 RepID=A0A3E1NX22_9BACT|nr:cellulase family glycosylhydrolase [Chitinophaga silvisoli]RFM32479.1 T9SS C-terminal target domain-containing protein [Chitinophaga silvisoli]
MKKTAILLINLLLAVYCSAQTPVSINGQLKVIGTKLCNRNGYPIQLRGMSTHGIQWYAGCITDASLDTLKSDWGADIVRIAMYVQEGGYETNPSYYTSLVKSYVDKVTARGLYALIDFHILSPGDPNYNTDRAKTFFTDIANTYKNYNNVLYEICNEPNGVSWATIKNYADQVIPLIRAIDDDAVICVGTRGWSSLGLSEGSTSQEILNNPLSYANVMYSFHFYARSHQDYYINHLDWASDRLPIFVTEFGTQEATGDGPNDLTMSQRYLDLCKNKKISWTNWNFSDNPYSGAVWNSGTCSGNTWTTSQLKEAGVFIRNNMRTADDFGSGNNNGTNIALGKTVTVSSTEVAATSLVAANAVDGNATTRWASAAGSDPQWITVDLGNTYSISAIKINWEAAYGKNFLVQVSADNANWTTLKDVQGNTSLSNEYTGLSGTGRFIRVYGTVRGTIYGYSIYELEVYGTLANTANLALNKTVTTSSVEAAGLEGNYAVDGNTATRWSATLYADPQWITVDLGNTYLVSEVKLSWEAAYAKDYLVQVSADNTNWITVKTISGNTSLVNDHTGLSASGRYVRIYGTARGSAYGYSIYELEVYGTGNSAKQTVSTSSKVYGTDSIAKQAVSSSSKLQDIIIYPVPAHDQVMITLPASEQKTYISLGDMNGTKYRSIATSESTYNMDISKLPAGIYFIMIQQGDQRTIRKIVKQ